MTVTKGKDGIPSWNGEPSTWLEYKRAAQLYVETTKWENRYLCGPRLCAELSGSARASIVGKKASWLSHVDGVNRLLKHLQQAISEPVLPEVGNALRAYFRNLKRRRGETMTSFCVRHREEYEKACRALTRMVRDQGGKPWTGSTTSGRPQMWQGVASKATVSSGPEHRPDQAEDSDSGGRVLQGSLDSSHYLKAPSVASSREELDPGASGTNNRATLRTGGSGVTRTGLSGVAGMDGIGESTTPATTMRTRLGLTSCQMSSRVGFCWRRQAWTSWRRASSSPTSSLASP